MDWVISILLFIIALASLICLHEIGHFSMAKLFKVYCHEFSIGFGPALIHKRKEGKETYFSLRAIPLGGYVSMYGEDSEEIEPGLIIPPERSIEGIKKWKKAIVLSAGIIMNALVAICLFGIRNLCFPLIIPTNSIIVEENSIAYNIGIESGDRLLFDQEAITREDGSSYYTSFLYQFVDSEGIIKTGNFYIIDNDVIMGDYHYVLGFDFYTTKSNNNFSDGISLYLTANKQDVLNEKNVELNKMFGEWAKKENSPEYYPDFTKNVYSPDSNTSFEANLIISKNNDILIKTVDIHGNEKGGYAGIGLSLEIGKHWQPINERFQQIWIDFGNSSSAVFKGLGTLFSKGGIKNMSGLVGIFTTSKTLYETQTFSTYLYFWGLISVNLAIFNFLPFPGLDGWQLLVTVIEGVSRKKLPNKFKQIMSIIGFVLLGLLTVAILVVDIGRLI